MTYKDALKLKPGDSVIVKVIKRELTVVSCEKDGQSNDVFVHCSDGKRYHHGSLLK